MRCAGGCCCRGAPTGREREGLGNLVVGEKDVENGFGGEGTMGDVMLRGSRTSGRKGGTENEGFGNRSKKTDAWKY